MRPLQEILIEALEHWDGESASMPAIKAIQELAFDGRFLEVTALLRCFVERFGRSNLTFTVGRVPGILLNKYVYRYADASHDVVDEYWGEREAGQAIIDAALEEGQLDTVMGKIIREINEKALSRSTTSGLGSPP
ncbi:hypothetical protein SAMN05216381_3216 [Pseudomonas seleniipraecipitans]|uniref:Uncharacterized protein n=2 Tax=Phytopseudomonas seleniipraecipitans TaxID=640205 RepID=A0A1G7RP13_9GAMM|nr:hypothetical protein SAMN05216381_3216 [Pseudomonas seleniipraecipitans]